MRAAWFGVFALAAATAVNGYHLTDWVFRARRIAYPFEEFGAAAAAALFCWTIAIGHLLLGRKKKKGDSR